ncbi:MAG: quinone-dependent dihydroorotate dehydrogenase [Candidatus Competibacteraceae bacterium]|nr:quinone-dependent dihydroorotate dehydrogenase [Candidatus Competibacteraceae bacterium]
MNLIRALSALARPVLQSLDPERAHALTISALRFAPAGHVEPDDPRLRVQAFGLEFPNPIGLAAGFDKNAQVTEAMLAFGFGFVEAGTVTPRPQAGNPKPRIFRLVEDRAVINRLGFNNEGMAAARARLTALQRRPGIRGINIGANKDSADRVADYVAGLKALGPLASYVTVNISSPNTPGLRGLQNKSELNDLLAALFETRAALPRRMPLLVKIAPDLDEQGCADIAEMAITHGIDGLIVTNTTVARPQSLKSRHAGEAGGLSGAPLFEPSTEILRRMRRLTNGRMTLIGVGGRRLRRRRPMRRFVPARRWCSFYTALTYDGPALVSRIKADLAACLTRDGLPDVSAAVGLDERKA